ncbi:MAG: MYG1 family protein [Succinivibrionaceae bacterium]|nr:MYG1 family protein [Succinivibrionaceae bacterium]
MAGAVQDQAGGMAAAKKKPLMAVHDGAFHADDCTAYSIMKHLHPSLELVRTRDPEVIATADYVMDVGGEYDNITKFDHHQKSFTEKRNDEFNTKYAAAGLTWRKFGKDYVKKELELAEDDDATAERVAARVDRNYMRFLDANDNGIDVGVPREYPGVPSAVAMYNAVVGTKGNSGFLAAARMCEMILRGEVRSEYRYICAEAEMLKAAKEAKDGIIETSESLPFTQVAFENWESFKDCEVVVYTERQSGRWRIQSLPAVLGQQFSRRCPAPKEWCGLSGERLQEVSGHKGFIFVHANGFTGGAETREQMLDIAEDWVRKSRAEREAEKK